MPLTPPTYVTAASVVGQPIKYKWSSDVAMNIGDAENDRLYTAIDASSFKAKFAIGLVLTEWIVWRLQGLADTADATRRIEAAWAGVVHPAYLGSLDHDGDADDDTEKAQGPLDFALANLADIASDYTEGNIYLAESVMRQALLAQHIMPDKKAFEAWLTPTLKATAKVFPRGADYDEDSEFHDASDETPVPRDFFEPAFAYSPQTGKDALRTCLLGLKDSGNAYLRPTKQLAKAGLKGTPYQLD